MIKPSNKLTVNKRKELIYMAMNNDYESFKKMIDMISFCHEGWIYNDIIHDCKDDEKLSKIIEVVAMDNSVILEGEFWKRIFEYLLDNEHILSAKSLLKTRNKNYLYAHTLKYSCIAKNTEFAKFILETQNAINYFDNSILNSECKSHPQILKMILEDSRTWKITESCISTASKEGNFDIVKVIVGSDKLALIPIDSVKGALANGHEEIAQYLLNHAKFIAGNVGSNDIMDFSCEN